MLLKRSGIAYGAVPCLVLLLGVTDRSFAQQSEETEHPVSISVGGGFTAITGYDAGRLDHGGNVQVGAGHFFNRYFGVTGNFMFNQLGITGAQLAKLNEPDGNARIYTFTVDPTFRLPLGHRVSAYVLSGGGYLRRTVEFTQPTLATSVIFDPWWGYFGPALVPANEILGSVTSNSGVFNVGGGANFPLPRTGFRLFMEARYVHGFTSNSNTIIVPLTFGLRW